MYRNATDFFCVDYNVRFQLYEVQKLEKVMNGIGTGKVVTLGRGGGWEGMQGGWETGKVYILTSIDHISVFTL